MYRNSDNSDSTASSRTHVTGQTGRKPDKGIFSQQNNTHKSPRDVRFDSIEIPVCVRQHRQTQTSSQKGAMQSTANIPAVSRPRHDTRSTGSFSTVKERTGSVPYLYSGNDASRQAEFSRTRTSTNAIPRVPAKRKKRVHPLLALLLQNKKNVITFAVLILCISVIVPLAVYAAVSDEDSSKADFEMVGTVPSDKNILDAEDVYFGISGENPVIDQSTATEDSTEPSQSTDDGTDTDMTDDTEAAETTDEAEESLEATPDEIPDEPVVPVGFKVTVQFYDRELLTCTTGPTTLRQILNAAGIWLTDLERPSVGLDDPIEYESWITVDKTEYKQVTESEAIPYSSETVNVNTVPRGTYRTATYGKNGVRDTVYTVEYVNGVEVNRTKEYDYVAVYPTNEVIYYGVGGTFTAPDGTTYSYSYCANVRATYYNIHGTTASGMPTGNNVIATDPNVFPLGTRMYVMNSTFDMGIKIAADVGGAVKGNLIDIWMDETSPFYEEFAFRGVWDMTVYILD